MSLGEALTCMLNKAFMIGGEFLLVLVKITYFTKILAKGFLILSSQSSLASISRSFSKFDVCETTKSLLGRVLSQRDTK